MHLRIVLSLLLCLSPSHSAKYEDLKILEDSLLNGLSTNLRPVNQSSDTVVLKVELSLTKIVELDVVKEVMVTWFGFRVTWIDQRLRWNETRYSNITRLSLPTSHIWTPDLHVLSSSHKDRRLEGHSLLQISRRGEVQWSGEMETRTWCSMHVRKFPFDKQTCSITISTVYSKESDVNITHVSYTDSDVIPNGDWMIESTWVQRQSLEKEQQTRSGMTLFCMVKRDPTYYVYTVLMPMTTVFIINPFVFLVKAKSGEKISTAVTLFLSFTVFISLFCDLVPQTSSSMPYVYLIVYLQFQFSAGIVMNVIITSRYTRACKPNFLSKFYACLVSSKKGKAVVKVQPTDSPNTGTKSDGGTDESPKDTEEESFDPTALVDRVDRLSFALHMFISVLFVVSIVLIFSL